MLAIGTLWLLKLPLSRPEEGLCLVSNVKHVSKWSLDLDWWGFKELPSLKLFIRKR